MVMQGNISLSTNPQAGAPGGEGGCYVNAFGLMYAEVTASNLVHVGLDGHIIDPGSTQLGVSGPGLYLHSAIHKSRPDIKCVIHLHNTATVAVSQSLDSQWNFQKMDVFGIRIRPFCPL